MPRQAGSRLSCQTLVPSDAPCAQPVIPALRLVRRVFKPFWHLALVQQAPPAIVLAALRRFGGPALLRGPRPSLSQGAPSWPSGLTLRSSRPAYGGRLTLTVSLADNFASKRMPASKAVTLASAHAARVGRRGGLRLQRLRQFQAFLASGAFRACASSYRFRSSGRCHPRPFSPVGSNPAVKPTRLRRAAYFGR